MRISRKIGLLTGALGFLAAGTAMAATETISFDSKAGASINFTYTNSPSGNTNITFLPNGAAVNDFQITGISGFSGANVLNGLNGDVEGTFSFNHNAISTGFLTESAPVTGAGSFIIHDGNGQDFTATMNWTQITENLLGEEIDGSVTLASFDYAGANLQLQQLALSTGATIEATFSFGLVWNTDLLELSSSSCSASHPCSTDFQGKLTATSPATVANPEPSEYGVLMVGLLGVMALVRRYRAA
jgi:hypothetical protein